MPLLLKMRTGDVGYMSYFGAIGFDASFRTRARVNNTYTWLGNSALQPDDEEDMDLNRQYQFHAASTQHYARSGVQSHGQHKHLRGAWNS